MPQLGMSMEQGTIVEWTLAEGDTTEKGDTIAVVESEKTTADIEARENGILGRIIVPEGGTVEPGDPIGILVGEDEPVEEYEEQLDEAAMNVESATTGSTGVESAQADTSIAENDTTDDEDSTDVRATPGARRVAEKAGIDLAGIEGTGPQGVIVEDDVRGARDTATDDGKARDADVRATPGARNVAEEEGVDLTIINGTGPQGVITEDDVTDHLAEREAPAAGGATRTDVETRSMGGMQKTIGERLGQSYREAVHVTLHRSFETATIETITQAAEDAGVDVSITDLIITAVGDALNQHPEFNGVFEDGTHHLVEEVNIGIAVDVKDGLVAPVIPAVGTRSVEEVAALRRELTERVQAGEFTMDDLSGGTFTISNLGPFGVDSFDPIINPPEIAILGIGRIRADGTMTLSLSFDHRVVNGADAARFLATITETLTDEASLAERFDAGLAVDRNGSGDRIARVETKAGYSGTYRTAHGEVAFDEPVSVGGNGSAPTPVEHLLGALGSCLSLSVRAMAHRDELDVGAIGCDVEGNPNEGPLSEIAVTLRIETDAADADVERVVTKAERACYVDRALSDELPVSVAWTRPN